MNDTIDTLIIKVEGDDQSAVKTLDNLISTLERVKNTTSSRSLNTLTSRLDSLRNTINNIKTKNLSKLSNMFSTLNSIQRINLPPSLPTRITEIGVAVRSLDGVDFTQLNAMASGLSAISAIGNVRVPRVSGRAAQAGAVTTPQNESVDLPSRTVTAEGLNRFEKYLYKLSGTKKQIEDCKRETTSWGKAIKTALSDTPVGKFVKAIREKFSALGRIAIYRLMRTLIKSITGAFKTGIDDMYQYSKTFNGSYAQSMDQLASANLSFKNSIGAIMAPLIELVTPWLDSLVDKLMDVNNTIAMVLAGLAGKSTYSKAVRVTTEYAKAADDASKDTDKVTNSVERLKRSLAGLDEITIIGEKLSPLSKSSSGITDGVDYGSMFVETPVDMDRVNEILEKLKRVLEIVKLIGIAIGTWSLGKFVGSILEALTGFEGLRKKVALGLTLTITGFAMEWQGGYHIGYGDADFWDYLKAGIGAALGAAGVAMLIPGPAGWIIGITAAISILVASISFGYDQHLSEMVEKAFFEMGGETTITEIVNQYQEYCNAIVREHQPVIDLGVEIDNVRENSILPAIESVKGIGLALEYDEQTANEKVKTIIEKLNSIYTDSKENLEKTRDLIIMALAGGLGDTLQVLGVEVPEAITLITGTTSEMREALDGLNKKVAELKDSYDKGKISAKEFGDRSIEYAQEYAKINGIVDSSEEALSKYGDTLKSVGRINWENKDAVEEAFVNIRTATKNATSSVNEYCDQLIKELTRLKDNEKDPAKKLDYVALINGTEAYRTQQLDRIKTQAGEFIGSVREDLALKLGNTFETLGDDAGSKMLAKVIIPIEEKVSDLFDELGMTSETKLTNLVNIAQYYVEKAGEAISKGLTNNKNKTLNSLDNMLNPMLSRFETFGSRVADSINSVIGGLAKTWGNAVFRADGSYSYTVMTTGSIPKFASGGFPEDGLFYANHNELVGQFSNGKSAVANNEQIITGIAEGVSSANEETNQLLVTLIGIGKQLLTKDSTVSVSTIASAFSRKNQRDGKTTVPVSN